jgi:uncharacterized protein YcfL
MRMVRESRCLIQLGLVALLLATSCGMHSGGTQAGTVMRTYDPNELVENSRMVANRLDVVRRDADRVNGLLRVQVTVENVTTESLEFEYRYTWFDAKGLEVKTPASVWQSVQVLAKDESYLTGVAPNDNVTDFKLVIRYPKAW